MLSITGSLKDTVGVQNPFRYRGYYYDTETEMYYLQSRYYDPEIRRFINADEVNILYVQQEILMQYNQYIYCFNNPINYIDVTGYVPQTIEDKWVHDQVLDNICKINTDLVWKKTCIYYKGKNSKGGRGFCDLYNKKTGEVWELKKQGTSISCTTAKAQEQLNKYIQGRLRKNTNLDLKLPYITKIRANNFTKKHNGYIYDIFYYEEGNGILRYDYNKYKSEARRVAETVTIAVLAAVVMCATGGAGGLIFV